MRQILWTEQELSSALKQSIRTSINATGISIDTRTLQPGDIFIAIHGAHVNSHAFVIEAFQKGAVAAIVSEPVCLEKRYPVLYVSDTLQALNDMAGYRRIHVNARYAAITGSVGKTSMKEMLAGALGHAGVVYSTAGNLNNHIGVPLSLVRMQKNTDFAIFEMGMNHAGEIRPLSKLVQPEVAVITTVDAVHLEFFDSVSAIADAKAEIFEGVSLGGTVLLPADNSFFNQLVIRTKQYSAITRIVGFGTSDDLEVQARLLDYEPDGSGSRIRAKIFGKTIAYRLALSGKHQALNSVAALAVVALWGQDIEKASCFFSAFAGAEGRGRRHYLTLKGKRHIELIDDSYNASPVSVKAALEVLSSARGRKIVVLGDMFELGEDAPGLHKDLLKFIIQAGIDRVFLAGTYMHQLFQVLPDTIQAIHVESAGQLKESLVDTLQDGDTVLIKGSHGMKMYEVVRYLVNASVS